MKLHLAPIPSSLHRYAHTDEVHFIRELMSGLLNHRGVVIQPANVLSADTISFSNTGAVLADLPTNTIWTHHARRLYPAERGTEREVRMIGRMLYDGYDMYQGGLIHSGYEYTHRIALNDEVRLVTHTTVGRNAVSGEDSSTFSITITTEGPIARACFKVEIDPKTLN